VDGQKLKPLIRFTKKGKHPSWTATCKIFWPSPFEAVGTGSNKKHAETLALQQVSNPSEPNVDFFILILATEEKQSIIFLSSRFYTTFTPRTKSSMESRFFTRRKKSTPL
jgi:hypothetical protein